VVIVKKTARKQNKRVSTSRQRKTQHLLDVKARAKSVADRRTQKVLFAGCAVVLIASVLGGVAFGTKHVLNALFFANPDYTVKTVDTTSDGTLSRETILKTAQIAQGQNIFLIELPKVQEKLATLPQVEESRVERILPNKLIISIQERRPVAWVGWPDATTGSFNFENAYLVDRRGMLLKTKSLVTEYIGLPLIIGVNTLNCQEGQPLEAEEVKAAIDLIRASSGILQARFQIQSVDVSKKYCLVVTDKQRASVTFSPDNIEWQLRRLETVLNYCDQNSRELQTVNLMTRRNVPVTFVPEAQPAVPMELPAKREPAAKPRLAVKPKSSPNWTSKVSLARKTKSAHSSRHSSRKQEKKTQPNPEKIRLKPFQKQIPSVRRAVPVESARSNG
jgi:cell division protein FtsQ